MRRKLISGNWKMHGLAADLAEVRALIAAHPAPACEIVVCAPATLVHRLAQLCDGTAIGVGGQTCHVASQGAHTGDISAAMLADAGATHVIVGHSERRADHGETDAVVARQCRAAWDAGLTAILCLGETGAERDAGRTLDVIGRQLARSVPDGATPHRLVLAYEPVWAIGTGRTPTAGEIAEVHGFIRAELVARIGQAGGDGVRILYGGSMKPGNAAEILAIPDVDGGLVGGASLKSADFGAIVAAADAA
jgi:triosephosphate isomerase (TIM)